MMVTAEKIMESAALTAVLCPLHPELVIRTALYDGVWAAKHGCGIPLPLLLDAKTLLAPQVGRLPIFRNRPTQWPAALAAYDHWLLDFYCTLQKSNVGRDKHRMLPLLIHAWLVNSPKSADLNDWLTAYMILQVQPTHLPRITDLWRKPRSGKAEQWQTWLPLPPRQIAVAPKHPHMPCQAKQLQSDEYQQNNPPWYWSNYATAASLDWLHESFDHPAARLYLDAKDISISPEQQRRIERLVRKQHQSSGDYTRESREEQNPYFGDPSLAELVKGPEWSSVGKPLRISGPPVAQPPPHIQIHFCFANAFAGIQEFVGALKVSAEEQPEHKAPSQQTAASALQGIAALLVDDWRFALRNLEQIAFFVHRGAPNLAEDLIGGGGERWKHDSRTQSAAPPPTVTLKFFQRRQWTDLNEHELNWPADAQYPLAFAWWCLCVLKCDLPELGFYEQAPTGDERQVRWRAKTTVLPACIAHVIVLDPSDGADEIFRVDRGRYDHEQLELRPELRRQAYAAGPTDSYHALRSHALDILLTVLESFYH